MKTPATTPTKVAVLLATFNGMPWLEKQIQSIHTQAEASVHMTVSDDGSTDGTFEWLQNHAEHYSLTMLPVKKTGGASQNFFRLLMETDLNTVDYVALADQDDIWLPHKLSRAIELIQMQNVDAYSANVLAFWPDGREVLIDKAQPQKKFDYIFESAGPGCTFVLTKKLGQALQDFLRTNAEACQYIALHDWLIYAFARSRGYHWFIDHEPGMLYRQHATNVVGANTGLKAMIARWKQLRQGWFSHQIVTIANTLGYANLHPIQQLINTTIASRFSLAFNAHKFRRRLRDQLAFVFYVLFIHK